MYLVTCHDHGDHGTCVSDEIDQKMKVGQNFRFYLRIFFPFHPLEAAYASGDHGDHGTSMFDEIDQKMKVCQNTWFFLGYFFSAHFDPWKLSKLPMHLVIMVTMRPESL